MASDRLRNVSLAHAELERLHGVISRRHADLERRIAVFETIKADFKDSIAAKVHALSRAEEQRVKLVRESRNTAAGER